MKHAFSPEKREAIYLDYINGVPCKIIGRKHDCSYLSVYWIAKRIDPLAHKSRKLRVYEEIRKKMARARSLKQSGFDRQTIQRLCGIGKSQYYRYLKGRMND